MDLAQPAFPQSLLTTHQLCRALSQPGVQGRWLSPLWQSCKLPQTVSCVLGGMSPPAGGYFIVEQLLQGDSFGYEAASPAAVTVHVRAGLRGVTGTLMGERGKEPWDGDPALDGPSGQVRGVESQQTYFL